MQASEIFQVGKLAYNGDDAARREWIAKIAPLAVRYGAVYGVLPSLAIGKAITESGWASDLYELELEKRFAVTLGRKAQGHNNIVGMNAFAENRLYLPNFPKPAWNSYQEVFYDCGPHWYNGKYTMVSGEVWKHFRSVEDCIEDWCANIRFQAAARRSGWPKEMDIIQRAADGGWGRTLEEQLVAIESYTPEGTKAEVPGMHFQWQDEILRLADTFGLRAFDREVVMEREKVTTVNLDRHIERAYEYAHAHCHYAPTDRVFPPFADNASDCAGLLFQAAYTMGYNNGRKNINQVPEVCEAMGLVKSTDPNDAWRHHGVVCMQDKHLTGTAHVSHVYYSLGGSGLDRISKFDLGSDRRIKCKQPYTGVPVNEWANDRNFLCVYYVKEKNFREDTPCFKALSAGVGRISVKTGLYAGPGTAWRRIGTTDVGAEVILRGVVTNDSGNQWRSVCYNSMQGYVPVKAVVETSFDPYVGMVSGTDGSLSVRVGAGVGAYKVGDIPEGKNVEVDNLAFADDGGKWLHIRAGKIRGYVAAQYVIKA